MIKTPVNQMGFTVTSEHKSQMNLNWKGASHDATTLLYP